MFGEIDLVLDQCSLWVGETLQLAGKRDNQDPEEWNNLVSELIMNDGYGFEIEKFALQGWEMVLKLLDLVKKQRVVAEQSSSKLLESQNSVIQLQQQLLVKQTEQISQIHAVVASTVTSTVEKGIQSYSDAVKQKTPEYNNENFGIIPTYLESCCRL